ncbi:hypothetical protein SDC9_136360 [bioreactor metagenome]|uniref:Uncharacterized protein n=1 Tax=bioreactor metagenome TaxID=1076179 RepID=A0A645DL21_9ZZZZ
MFHDEAVELLGNLRVAREPLGQLGGLLHRLRRCVVPDVLIRVEERKRFVAEPNVDVGAKPHGVEIVFHLLHHADGIDAVPHLQRKHAVGVPAGQVVVIRLLVG